MRNAKSIEDIVRGILITEPHTRDDDERLYFRVCQLANPGALNMPMSYVLMKRAELGLPKYNTVCRIRRMVQVKDPKLQASKEALDGRYEEYKLAKEYAAQ